MKAYRLLLFGFDPIKTVNSIKGIPYYFQNLILLKRQQKTAVKDFPFTSSYPCLGDRFLNSGNAKGHYFHQDLLIAKKIYQNKPKLHVDIGSRVDGFVAHVAAFRKIEVFDIRPLSIKISNISFRQVDLMDSNVELLEYCDSLSTLHAIEHFGLGRYGDPINYDGYLLGLNNLYKILKKGGKLYLSVPIGPQRIEFDAHRIFSICYLLELFQDKYHIDSFSYVDDAGDLHEDVQVNSKDKQDNFNCIYGCGIFEMTKI
jgi:SAM-dependent methyltransferase